jgi:type II secretory pathway pseudopilin PulG
MMNVAIPFNCPHCGAPQNAEDRYAGMSGPCTACGKQVTVPSAGMSPMKAAGAGAGIGTVLLIVGGIALVVLLGCGGVMAALLLPAVQAARTSARQMQSMNNEKQILLALHNYHDVNGTFPPAYIADKDGKPMTSWRVLILPYIEQQGLASQYDYTKPWDSPENMQVAQNIPQVYRSPLEETNPQNRLHTSYLFFAGKGSAFETSPVSMNSITDGTSNTLVLAEINNSGVIWTQPTDLDTAQLDFMIHSTKEGRPGQLNTNSPRGLNVGLMDGSVRVLPKDTPAMDIKSAVDPRDGRAVMLP